MTNIPTLPTMQMAAALAIQELAPYCLPDRCEVAGSIRRRKKNPKDVEIVCVPQSIAMVDLFGAEMIPARSPGFCTAVNKWERVKGQPEGRYTQRVLPSGIVLDLFMVTLDTWGTQYAIRTGPAEYSHKVLACRWCQLGYKMEGGMLYRGGEAVPVRTERELFDLLGLRWVEPEDRYGRDS